MRYDKVKSRIQRAIDRVKDIDGILFGIDVHERTIAHKLAQYLDQEFPEWDVDVEYNRQAEQPKRLEGYNTENGESSKVYPDIIIHKRRGEADEQGFSSHEENLVVIEIKTAKHEGQDINKIEAFREKFGYSYGLFVDFHTNGDYRNEEQIWRPEQ